MLVIEDNFMVYSSGSENYLSTPGDMVSVINPILHPTKTWQTNKKTRVLSTKNLFLNIKSILLGIHILYNGLFYGNFADSSPPKVSSLFL